MKKETQKYDRSISGRQRILRAAQKHFQKHSYADTRVEDICIVAGISKGAFYLHFKTKEAMVVELFKDFFHQYQQSISAFLESNEPTPMAALELFRLSMEGAEQQLHLTRVFFEAVGQEIVGDSQGLNDFAGGFFDTMASNLQKWMGYPTSERSRLRALISCMDGIVLHWAFFDTPAKVRKRQTEAFLEMVDHSTSGVLPAQNNSNRASNRSKKSPGY
ncbi:MAG: TetR/AcrR family transcriptional regulator [Leptospiraceae bacterium]|nr:TetR/AcrR family transcriptional regulator [Leptospiraceae bacterium]